jgi:hypothetical protein
MVRVRVATLKSLGSNSHFADMSAIYQPGWQHPHEARQRLLQKVCHHVYTSS